MTCRKQVMSAAEQMLPEQLVVKCFAKLRMVMQCHYGDISSQFTVCYSQMTQFLLEKALICFVDFIVFPNCLLCQALLSVQVYSLRTLSWWSQGSNQLLSNYLCLLFYEPLQHNLKRNVGRNDPLTQWDCIFSVQKNQ